METHRAAAQQHDGGHSLVDFRHEDRAFGQRQVEIFGADLQIARRELLRRVQCEPIQAFDRRKPFAIDDHPVAIGSRIAYTPKIKAPGRDSRAVGIFGEQVHHYSIAVAGQRSAQLLAVAFLDHGARHRTGKFVGGELANARPLGIERRRGKRIHVASFDNAFEAAKQLGDAVRRLRRHGHCGGAQCQRQCCHNPPLSDNHQVSICHEAKTRFGEAERLF